MQNYALFDPHQLDSDWRFDETTVKLLLAQSASVANLLLMGCPTISAALSGHVGKSVLLERNPNNFRTSKSTNIKTDLRFFSPRRYQFEAFDASIFDPPWYMAELFAWLNVAIWCTKKGGTIAFTLWPKDTRPNACNEHKWLFQYLRSIGPFRVEDCISYEPSLFESEALDNRSFKRNGLLVTLTKLHFPLLKAPSIPLSQKIWHRFLINGAQVAICHNPSEISLRSPELFKIRPFKLANTSRRNTQVLGVNFWTSSSVVGRLNYPRLTIKALRTLQLDRSSKSQSAIEFLRLVLPENTVTQQLLWGQTWTHRA